MTNFVECGSGVTAPKGFLASGLYCGIRKAKKDIALIYSETPASVAAVFTLNKTQAAPILVDKIQLKRSSLCSAVLVNSGNANACTGERGLNDAWQMVRTAAEVLAIPEEQVMVSSTGIIGQYLPMEKITASVPELKNTLRRDGSQYAADAIMTTDTFSKQVAVQFSLGNSIVTIGGMAKGSGMIAPNMATMLGFITTDALIPQLLLMKALQSSNRKSFNRISVDGDMSTNDQVILLANGMAQNPPIAQDSEEYALFCSALDYVLIKLAKMIARDGEGATKLIEIIVKGAASEGEAEQAARSVANSNLVKTAIHGADANWGRIIAAVGYSGIEMDPNNVEVSFGDLQILKKNYEILLDEDRAKEILTRDFVVITINLNNGGHAVRFWTCDLTKEYVHINASYRS
ncbi:MAG: bifunctional glutamate N-acetyltransferase/amino-acid acetyltransferase ArgJ [bacterium]